MTYVVGYKENGQMPLLGISGEKVTTDLASVLPLKGPKTTG
ncbi:hypothetical protein THTE_3990 [Thermogutta terrifontis]|uniref:Uncharacterized protein n=1 Tax=Thermogutta terrifontis TaxID=1331910 RepID=A0A286RKV8_9BACT|nr:hypothetical protein THTE_3990 [Thermogutta terrifontis]